MLAGLIALGLGAGTAQAGGFHYDECYHHCHYKKVVTYVCKEVPYTKCITLYDHCGHPYTVHKTFYKTVHVPVVKLVKVCY
jgi:hypothetical protein